jgi:hypothetical protein
MTSMSPRGVARVDGVVMRVDILKKNFWEFLAVCGHVHDTCGLHMGQP